LVDFFADTRERPQQQLRSLRLPSPIIISGFRELRSGALLARESRLLSGYGEEHLGAAHESHLAGVLRIDRLSPHRLIQLQLNPVAAFPVSPQCEESSRRERRLQAVAIH